MPASDWSAFHFGASYPKDRVRQDLGNGTWQSELSRVHNNIGDVLSEQGDSAGALREFRAEPFGRPGQIDDWDRSSCRQEV
jgi:hypothetical protein